MALNDEIPEPLDYLLEDEIDEYRRKRAAVEARPESEANWLALWALEGVVYETHKKRVHPGPDLHINVVTGAIYYQPLDILVEAE